MILELFKSKLHMLTVTEATLYYEGSITTDDRVIVISYGHYTPEEAKTHEPHIVIMDKDNEPTRIVSESVYRETYAVDVGL